MSWKPLAWAVWRATNDRLIGAPHFQDRLKQIRLVCLDLDGVLTDGSRTYHDNGSTSLAFDVRDGLGVYMLTLAAVEVALISNGRTDIVSKRAEELGIRSVMQGVDDKAAAVGVIAGELQIPVESRLYVGDDVWDLPAFGQVGFRVAVAGAVPEVVDSADAVTVRGGGRGAVREVADAILKAQGYAWQGLLQPPSPHESASTERRESYESRLLYAAGWS